VTTDASGRIVHICTQTGHVHGSDNYLSSNFGTFTVDRSWGQIRISDTGERMVVKADNNVFLSNCNIPSSPPTVAPTVGPSPDPTASPTRAFFAGETFQSKSGYGFSAITPAGEVVTWGKISKDDYPSIGVVSTEARTILSVGEGSSIVASRTAYAALKAGGAGLTAWGVKAAYTGASQFDTTASAITNLVANDAAFAGVLAATGTVIAFGAAAHGGNVTDPVASNGHALMLASGVADIAASAGAFAARREDGSVFSWGNKFAGAGASSLPSSRPDLVNVTEIVASRTAFAALTSTGSVVTFGDRYGGGDSSTVAFQLQANVTALIASQSVFVAFKLDNSIVVWGNPYYGADISSVAGELASGGIATVAHTAAAFAALKEDGSVITWGKSDFGGDSSAVAAQLNSQVWSLHSNHYAFAALKEDGSVVVWGDENSGGYITPASLVDSKLTANVTTIFSTKRAFAALKSDGELVLWGSAYHGGGTGNDVSVAAMLTSGVRTVCSNDAAFTAIKDDGSAVVWGHAASIPVPGLLTGAPSLIDATCA